MSQIYVLQVSNKYHLWRRIEYPNYYQETYMYINKEHRDRLINSGVVEILNQILLTKDYFRLEYISGNIKIIYKQGVDISLLYGDTFKLWYSIEYDSLHITYIEGDNQHILDYTDGNERPKIYDMLIPRLNLDFGQTSIDDSMKIYVSNINILDEYIHRWTYAQIINIILNEVSLLVNRQYISPWFIYRKKVRNKYGIHEDLYIYTSRVYHHQIYKDNKVIDETWTYN